MSSCKWEVGAETSALSSIAVSITWSLSYIDKVVLNRWLSHIVVLLSHTPHNWQGSHPTGKTLKTLNFVIFFSRPGKCLEFAQKVVKTWNFNSKPGKKNQICKFYVWSFTFQDVIYKSNSDLLRCHIRIINTNTDSKPNWPWILLLLPGNNLENTCNFVLEDKWEPCICFNTFLDLYI